MDLDKARDFVRNNHQAVLATQRSDGRPQMSPITVGIDGEGRAVISSRERAYKVRNIRRHPDVSLCVMGGGYDWIQVDGVAEIVSLPEAMELLVDYYRGISGEHPDWDDYRKAMADQHRVVIRITIERAGPDKSA